MLLSQLLQSTVALLRINSDRSREEACRRRAALLQSTLRAPFFFFWPPSDPVNSRGRHGELSDGGHDFSVDIAIKLLMERFQLGRSSEIRLKGFHVLVMRLVRHISSTCHGNIFHGHVTSWVYVIMAHLFILHGAFIYFYMQKNIMAVASRQTK